LKYKKVTFSEDNFDFTTFWMIHPKRCEITQISKLFIARVSMPMHTERDIVMANLSVCPSHCDLYRNECNRQTVSTIWNEAFFSATTLTKFQMDALSVETHANYVLSLCIVRGFAS